MPLRNYVHLMSVLIVTSVSPPEKYTMGYFVNLSLHTCGIFTPAPETGIVIKMPISDNSVLISAIQLWEQAAVYYF